MNAIKETGTEKRVALANVSLPVSLKKQIDDEAQVTGNRSRLATRAFEFFFKYRHLETELETLLEQQQKLRAS